MMRDLILILAEVMGLRRGEVLCAWAQALKLFGNSEWWELRRERRSQRSMQKGEMSPSQARCSKKNSRILSKDVRWLLYLTRDSQEMTYWPINSGWRTVYQRNIIPWHKWSLKDLENKNSFSARYLNWVQTCHIPYVSDTSWVPEMFFDAKKTMDSEILFRLRLRRQH